MASALDPIVKRAEAAIGAYLRTKVRRAEVFSFGAIEINPRHLAIWVRTRSDRQRNRLARDPQVTEEMRRLLAETGYPAEAVPLVGFAFESDETVRREYGGNWWHAVK